MLSFYSIFSTQNSMGIMKKIFIIWNYSFSGKYLEYAYFFKQIFKKISIWKKIASKMMPQTNLFQAAKKPFEVDNKIIFLEGWDSYIHELRFRHDFLKWEDKSQEKFMSLLEVFSWKIGYFWIYVFFYFKEGGREKIALFGALSAAE